MSEVAFGYEVVRVLSRRADVATLECRDDKGDRFVIKRLESPSAPARERLEQRAEALRALDHPGLARFVELATDGDELGLVYEWVDGETLAEQIDAGKRWTDDELYSCMREVLEALRHAHSQDVPVVHRDIKPHNLVWTGDRYVLIDFGSTREGLAESGRSSVVGTTGYSAPEQFVGNAVPASDQYGLAATILHMATHRHPTEFPLAGLRIDLSSTNLSTPLRRVLSRMLSPRPEDRFASDTEALETVARENALESWQVVMERLDGLDTVVAARRAGDELVFQLGTRGSITRGVLFVALAILGTAMVFGQMELSALDLSAAVQTALTLFIYSFWMFSFYFGAKGLQELRDRSSAVLAVSRDGWRLARTRRQIEVDEVTRFLKEEQHTVSGDAGFELRVGARSEAQTSGIAPQSVREGLVVEGRDGREHQFAPGLLPVEARTVVDAANAFLEHQSKPKPEDVEFVFEPATSSEAAATAAEPAHQAKG